jgi:glutaminase
MRERSVAARLAGDWHGCCVAGTEPKPRQTLFMSGTTDLTSPIQDLLQELHGRLAGLNEGAVATYIPELAKANPDWFGISLVTANGHIYEVGDSRQPFTIQSISKPFVYGLALEDNTRAEVLKKVGVEPTGDAFNAISLEPGTGRPRNPMINAGAIAAAGLIAGKTAATRSQRMLDMFSRYVGEEVVIDDAVYRSESETGHRNRAIGHMLRNFDILTEPPDAVVDLYFKQCSVTVTSRSLAVMAATLANRGINPLTGRQAIRGEYVESVLSVMGSCGMYDFAGEWLYRVGMPAKSGVAGGVIAVLPGQLGIGVFSPPLDSHGNSVRGVRVCDELSRHFDLHLFNTPHASKSVVRLKFSAAEVSSSRVRTLEEAQTLRADGHSILVYQLQGYLALSTAEVVVHEVMSQLDCKDAVILDFKYVLAINESACRLIYQLLLKLNGQGKQLIFTNVARVPHLRRYLKAKLKDQFESLFRAFDENDTALEWCENRLLSSRCRVRDVNETLGAASYELLAGLGPDEVSTVQSLFERRKFKAGELIVQIGEPAGELFFLSRGRVSVTVPLAGAAQKRLATFEPGMAFGEMAMLDRAPRSAVVVADTEVECDVLALDAFDRLGETHPRIEIAILRNLALSLSRKLRKANREMSVFDY